MYCDRCAGALLGLEVIGHIGLSRASRMAAN
jgi:hypothetical protein